MASWLFRSDRSRSTFRKVKITNQYWAYSTSQTWWRHVSSGGHCASIRRQLTRFKLAGLIGARITTWWRPSVARPCSDQISRRRRKRVSHRFIFSRSCQNTIRLSCMAWRKSLRQQTRSCKLSARKLVLANKYSWLVSSNTWAKIVRWDLNLSLFRRSIREPCWCSKLRWPVSNSHTLNQTWRRYFNS